MSCMWLWHLYCNAFAYVLSSHACCEQSCIHPRQATVSLHHLFEKTLASCCLDTFLWKLHYVPHALSLRTCILSTPSTRSLYADLLCRIYLPECLSRSPQQDPEISTYEDFLCKMCMSRSSWQDPVGALVQDQCTRISVRCQDPLRALVQDRCMWIS